MVRRGSPVRVRKRASPNALETGVFSLSGVIREGPIRPACQRCGSGVAVRPPPRYARHAVRPHGRGPDGKHLTFKRETAGGAPADPPSLTTIVALWRAGDTIPLGARTLP